MSRDKAGGAPGSGFVGRENELKELSRGLDDTFAGHGRLFLVSGEPGMGKTRLADELAGLAAARGAVPLWGRCWEGGGAPPYWPWVQILRAAVAEREAAATALESVGVAASELVQLAPEVGGLVPSLSPPPTKDPDVSRFYLFDVTTLFLRALAARAPRLVILDDLHAADADSLLLLQFLARDLRSAKLMLVGTYREAELRQSPLAETMGSLGREGTHLPLRGLPAEDVGALVSQAMPTSAGDREAQALPAAVLASLHQVTDGNPFFVRETVGLWLQAGQWPPSQPLEIPERVREAARRRVDLLPAETRELLSVAAVIGREFDASLLCQVLAKGEASVPEAVAVLERLHPAVTLGLLREVTGATARYTFAHVLTREALYAEFTASQRLRWHRATGRGLETHHQGNLTPHLADIAHHYYQAAADGDGAAGIAYAGLAAERATALCAYQEAVQHRERALELHERAASGDDAAPRCALLLALGAAQNAAGQRKQAKDTFRLAAEAAGDLRDPRALAHAALGYSGSWVGTQELTRVDAPDPMQPDDLAARLIEQALELLGESDLGLRASLLGRLAVETYITAPYDVRERTSRDAVALARRAGDPITLAITLCDRHLAVWGPDNLEERHAMAAEVVKLSQGIRDPGLSLMAIAWLTHDLFELGEVASMEEQIARFRRLAEADRQPGHLWGLASFRAMLALLRGNFAESEQLLEAAFAIGREVTPIAPMAYSMAMTQLEGDLGRGEGLEGKLPVSTMLADQFPQFPAFRTQLALQYAHLGRLDEARREFERVAERGFEDLRRDIGFVPQLCELSDICALLGDRSRAAVLYRLLLPCAEHNALSPFVAVSYGSVARPLGALATLLGEFEAAEAHYRRARERNLALGARPWLARTQYGLAALYAERGGPEHAAPALEAVESCIAAAEGLGMLLLLLDAQALRRRLLEGAAPESIAATVSEEPGSNVFRRQKDEWTISFAGRTCRLRDTRGLRCLAHLLRHPSLEVHALDLAAASEGRGLDELPVAAMARKRKLDELAAEVEEAERLNDAGRAERGRAALETMRAEILRSVRGSDEAERARLNVTRAITAALKRIDEHHPALARHLSDTVRTGMFCSYTPDSRFPTLWE